MTFEKLSPADDVKIKEMSDMAAEIFTDHYVPIIGKAQNDYMIGRFLTPEAIKSQLECGYSYYFVSVGGQNAGFIALYPKKDCMYLSKFYLYKEQRGKGYSKKMLDFVLQQAADSGYSSVELNVNRKNGTVSIYEKLGFELVRSEKIDIGSGFYMDDYVYRYSIKEVI